MDVLESRLRGGQLALFEWETKPCSQCKQYKPLADFCKNKVTQDGRHWHCRECERVKHSAWYAMNAEYSVAKSAEWANANRKRSTQAKLNWTKRNRHYANEMMARYRAKKKKATPAWSDHGDCSCFYESARRVGDCLGIPHDVDHILPLRGKKVSGLHVPANLQVLPAVLNATKSNKFDPASMDRRTDPWGG